MLGGFGFRLAGRVLRSGSGFAGWVGGGSGYLNGHHAGAVCMSAVQRLAELTKMAEAPEWGAKACGAAMQEEDNGYGMSGRQCLQRDTREYVKKYDIRTM
jgi:hypothetical protein